MFSLQDKIAVVTGGGSGIGESIAHRLAGAGAMVYVADVQSDAGERVARAVNEKGGQARFVHCDVSKEAACREVARMVIESHQRCNIVVNNAGIGHVGTALTTTADDLDRLHAVNVKGVLFMSQAFLPGMIERRSGSIVNMASIGGIVAVKDRLAYCASKFAVVGLTKCMALDHAESGVRVNCICPGRVYTPFVEQRLKEYPDPKKAFEQMSATQALGRMGTPDEIAAAAHYLAADESSFVTGSALIIDGGFSVGK
jgi:2-keto-3-deoxy-L-fuconate dehydrogenase